jgi:hypothetical protein
VKSASLFDEFNKDYLYNTIPEYLRDDPQNEPYKVFVNMIGQHYDNIWVYYKDVSNRYNGDNRLEYGISKDLVADAIRSFGLKIYQNNFSVNDLFNAFTGFNSGSYLRTTNPNPVDAEEIEFYLTASQASYYTPLDDVNKEMYKRIYHNLPYLLKSKGTVAGLQNIISMFGITSSILSVKEFGGVWTSGVPVTGIQDIVTDNIQILSSAQMSQSFLPIIPPNTTDATYAFVPQFVLSSQKSILENYNIFRSLSPSVNTIEVTFSPQNDIDNYIKSQGNFDIGEYIGIPSQTFLPYYPNLYSEADSILDGAEYDLSTYIRLIKYFDNSLFNMIKDFVPARTNLKSGITIKPHLLNRSKIVQPQVYISSSVYTGSINTAFISGGTGGTFDDYNSLSPILNNTQSWNEYVITPVGPPVGKPHRDQSEFYNGEFPIFPTKIRRYSAFLGPIREEETIVTDGELNPDNSFKYNKAVLDNNSSIYSPITYYYSNDVSFSYYMQGNGYAPSNGGITAWVRKKQLVTPKGVTTILYLEHLKISVNSVNGINSRDALSILQSVTLPYKTPTLLYYITVPVQVSNYVNHAGGFYDYTVSPYVLPTNQDAIPYSDDVYFFPNENIVWDYYEYNPIINNTFGDTTSLDYMEADYGSGITYPYNISLLIAGTANKAAVQDSNYSSAAWSNIRYNGSRQSSYDFNIPLTS